MLADTDVVDHSGSVAPVATPLCRQRGGGPTAVNGSTVGSAGLVLSYAALYEEGRRGEYRRLGRAMLADASQRAAADGMQSFAFPCALPTGVFGILAARSAAEACRLGTAIVAHRCTPPEPPGAAAAAPPSSPASGARRLVCRPVPSRANLPPACNGSAARSAATAGAAAAVLRIEGCPLGCVSEGPTARRSTRRPERKGGGRGRALRGASRSTLPLSQRQPWRHGQVSRPSRRHQELLVLRSSEDG